MNFFTAHKQATYAEAAFKAAGLDLAALAAAGNVDVLKAALAARPDPNPELEAGLAEAVKENGRIVAEIAELKKQSTANITAVCAAAGISAETITANGVVSEEKAKAAFDAKTAIAARTMIAKSGHPPVEDVPAAAVAAAPGAKAGAASPAASDVTGRDRMARAFQQQANRLLRQERSDN